MECMKIESQIKSWEQWYKKCHFKSFTDRRNCAFLSGRIFRTSELENTKSSCEYFLRTFGKIVGELERKMCARACVCIGFFLFMFLSSEQICAINVFRYFKKLRKHENH